MTIAQILAGVFGPEPTSDAKAIIQAIGLGQGVTAGTFTNQALGASASATIPAGARNWSVTILTGTATIGSAASLPAGFSTSDSGPLGSGLTVTTDSASSAYLQYTS